jgi:hypothetical protein
MWKPIDLIRLLLVVALAVSVFGGLAFGAEPDAPTQKPVITTIRYVAHSGGANSFDSTSYEVHRSDFKIPSRVNPTYVKHILKDGKYVPTKRKLSDDVFKERLTTPIRQETYSSQFDSPRRSESSLSRFLRSVPEPRYESIDYYAWPSWRYTVTDEFNRDRTYPPSSDRYRYSERISTSDILRDALTWSSITPSSHYGRSGKLRHRGRAFSGTCGRPAHPIAEWQY